MDLSMEFKKDLKEFIDDCIRESIKEEGKQIVTVFSQIDRKVNNAFLPAVMIGVCIASIACAVFSTATFIMQ